MKNWATLPYELLKLIVESLRYDNDTDSLKQFQLVCKHWNAASAYITFQFVLVCKLEKLSSLTALILRNRAIGAAIKQLKLLVTMEEVEMERQLQADEFYEESDALLQNSVTEFERIRAQSYQSLLGILLRFVPNVQELRFTTKDAIEWYDIVATKAEYLKNVRILEPPNNFREIPFYNRAAYNLRDSLEKVTFMNLELPGEDTFGIYRVTSMAKYFTSLKEIRVELLEGPRCLVPELESIIDVIPHIDYIVIACTLAVWNTGATKLVFPEVDMSTITPLENIKRLRGLHCYFCDDNAIKYITHKFPNVYELTFNVRDEPWRFYNEFSIADTPNQLSPRAQTDFFTYFMNMSIIDIFGIYLKTDIPSMMTRWTHVADKIKDKYISLVMINDDRVESNCSYIFWRKFFLYKDYEIKMVFNDNSGFQYTRLMQNMGRCLQSLLLEYLDINSEILTQIYEGCPSLSQIVFVGATIQNEIDTGETTSKLERMCFKEIESESAHWIPSITRSLPELYTLEIIRCDILEPKENPPEDNRFKSEDLKFDISATHAYDIIYVPTYVEFILPWCVIINDEKLFLIEDAFVDTPPSHTIFANEVPMSDYDKYEKEISSKKDYRYCIRIKCQQLHCFKFSKDFIDRINFEHTWGDEKEPASADNIELVLM